MVRFSILDLVHHTFHPEHGMRIQTVGAGFKAAGDRTPGSGLRREPHGEWSCGEREMERADEDRRNLIRAHKTILSESTGAINAGILLKPQFVNPLPEKRLF